MLMHAYPNPFGGDITILCTTLNDEEASFTITDVAGRIVEAFTHRTGSIQTGRKLSPGIYFVSMIQGNSHRTLKIVKTAE